MWSQRLMWVLWPAFLGACLLEGLVFALVDPEALHWFGRHVEVSREAVYTLGFFGFWAVCVAVAALTITLALPGEPSVHEGR